MNQRINSLILSILLIFYSLFLLEATGIPQFLIRLGSFPLTLGRSGLVICGILSFFISDKKYLKSKFAISIYAISIGYFLGSFFSNDFSYEFLKSLIIGLVQFSTITTAYLLEIKIFRKITIIYIFIIFIYWTLYSILAPQNITGDFLNYNVAYAYSLENELDIINYHKVGLLISASTLAIFEFRSKLTSSYLKFIPLSLGLIFLFNLGSRSNLLIIVAFLIFKFFNFFKVNKKNILNTIIFVLLLSLIILLSLSLNEEIRNRLSIINPTNIFAINSRFQLFINGIKEILQNPLGTGPSDNRIDFFGYQFQPHNQYLTFGIGAGLLGLLGSLSWINIVYKSFILINKVRNIKLLPYFTFTAVYLVTMLSNDQSGALLFLNLIFIQYLEMNSIEEYYLNKNS